MAKLGKGMLFSLEQAFVGRDERRAPLKTYAWEATQLLASSKISAPHQFSPHVRESKKVLDSGFYAVDSGFQTLSVELEFWIPNVSRIPDSLSCIPDTKAQDYEFQV